MSRAIITALSGLLRHLPQQRAARPFGQPPAAHAWHRECSGHAPCDGTRAPVVKGRGRSRGQCGRELLVFHACSLAARSLTDVSALCRHGLVFSHKPWAETNNPPAPPPHTHTHKPSASDLVRSAQYSKRLRGFGCAVLKTITSVCLCNIQGAYLVWSV